MRRILPFIVLLLTQTLTSRSQDTSSSHGRDTTSSHSQDTTSIKKDSIPWDEYHAVQAKLDAVMDQDQSIRKDYQVIINKYNSRSRQVDSITKRMHHIDSSNLVEVKNVLDHQGWLGIDAIGEKANLALFLVIQHSDPATQVKYLPMMRDAVKEGHAKPEHLALLEDRVLTNQGKPQLYGSQVHAGPGGKYVFYPIADEKNVNNRRGQMNLEPLEEYARSYNIDYHLPEQ